MAISEGLWTKQASNARLHQGDIQIPRAVETVEEVAVVAELDRIKRKTNLGRAIEACERTIEDRVPAPQRRGSEVDDEDNGSAQQRVRDDRVKALDLALVTGHGLIPSLLCVHEPTEGVRPPDHDDK